MKHSIELLDLTKSKEKQFIDKGITSVEDIAYFFPRRYIDFRNITNLKDVEVGKNYALQGTVIDIRSHGLMFTAVVQEEKEVIKGYYPCFSVVWFGTDYHIKKLEIGKQYVFCGRVSEFAGELQISSPLAFGRQSDVCTIMPIYSKIQGMSNEYLQKQIKAAISFLKANEKPCEKDLLAKSLPLMDKFAAIAELHQPTDGVRFRQAQQRMAYESIYDFYAELNKQEIYSHGNNINAMPKERITQKFIKELPFELTDDQKTAIDTIINNASQGKRVNALVSGDVGCGKTVIAILSAIFAWENGYQTIIMAPTLVLAQQHFKEMESCANKLGIKIDLLSTARKKRERTKILKDFADGTLNVLIGTHSVLSGDIKPYKLGFTIIDEEHKFGVKQKECLEKFNQSGIDHISMTATPIPRSIARVVYGRGVSVLSIKTMPNGRLPVQTKQCFNQTEMLDRIYEEVQEGRQAFIICPFIHESESERFKDVISVETMLPEAKRYFASKPNKVRIGVITGDMKQDDITDIMNKFAAHEFDVLLSTTIVEVGVNVPNATVMAVMSAERFGLAALHQLRGRVGRGNLQSYCLLCSPVKSERIDIMCSTNDGFEIAERDMQLRGSGDILGNAQSGISDVIQMIMQRPNLTAVIRRNIFQENL